MAARRHRLDRQAHASTVLDSKLSAPVGYDDAKTARLTSCSCTIADVAKHIILPARLKWARKYTVLSNLHVYRDEWIPIEPIRYHPI